MLISPTTYVCTLPKKAQYHVKRALLAALRETVYDRASKDRARRDFARAMSSRLCDLEDLLPELRKRHKGKIVFPD